MNYLLFFITHYVFPKFFILYLNSNCSCWNSCDANVWWQDCCHWGISLFFSVQQISNYSKMVILYFRESDLWHFIWLNMSYPINYSPSKFIGIIFCSSACLEKRWLKLIFIPRVCSTKQSFFKQCAKLKTNKTEKVKLLIIWITKIIFCNFQREFDFWLKGEFNCFWKGTLI